MTRWADSHARSVVALLVAVSTATLAAQSVPAPPSAPAPPTSAFQLAQATVSGLTLAGSVQQSIDRIDRDRVAEPGRRFEAISEARRGLDRSREGTALFSKTYGAPGSPVRSAAAAMRATFGAMSMRLAEVISQWEKLATAGTENDTVDLVRSSTAILADEGPWQMLAQATRDVSLALLDTDRAEVRGDTKSARHLRLTRSERDGVLESLKRAFPQVTTKSGGNRHADVAAATLFEFLNRPWVNADEP